MKKVNYALIGFGGIAENRIAKEGFGCDRSRFDKLPNAELAGVFDVNPARREAAAKLGLKWFGSIEEILGDPGIDAVYVATNNATHAAIVLRALESGKHAISEKPIATTAADGRAMIRRAAERRLSLCVDHMMVCNAYNKLARKYVASGKLGKVGDSCFHMEFSFGSTPAEAATWRCSKPEELGGPIGDVASHCIYMAEYILGGRISEVRAVYLPKILKIATEDGAFIRFVLDNGQTGSFRVSFSESRGGAIGTFSNLGFEIYGDAAVLRGFGTMTQLSGFAGEFYAQRLELENFTGVKRLHPRKFENIYRQIVMRHAQSILDGKPLDASDGLRNLNACIAMHRSARSGGKAVSVD